LLKKEIKMMKNVPISLNLIDLEKNLENIEKKISLHSSSKNNENILKHIENLSDGSKNFNINQMWKLRKKLCPKNIEMPSAKFNEKGRLVNDKSELKKLYQTTYIQRLRHREILPEYQTIFHLKSFLFDLRMMVTSKIKSPDWSMDQLVKVLKSLKNNKSADHSGMVYELFKPGLIGEDLLKSLLILCNQVKIQQKIPQFLKYTDITSFYKQKGDRRDLENDRGVFGVMKIRSIIDKLAYNDYYEEVNQNMSDSNAGARGNRNICDNLFVVYAIRNEALRKNISVDLHLMDLSKCFDIMWSKETMNDLYDLGVKDDRFVLISKMNEECRVTVKTPVGNTDEFTLTDIEMQGTVPAPLKCAGQMDALGRQCYTEENYLYNYNGSCLVPSLGFIDDTFAATRCGMQSVEMNALINTFIESKKLYFNTSKCFQIHLGPRKEECCKLKVHDKIMKQVDSEKYLGDIVSNSGNEENIAKRKKLGMKSISDILSTLKEFGIGCYYVKTGLSYRDAILKCKLLLNSEVWHSLTIQQISVLEDVDRTYLRWILNSHPKVAIEVLHFETGTQPLKYDIMRKRLMYLWKILHSEESELIKRVYKSQALSPHQGDWVRLVEQDMVKLKLNLSKEEITLLSKQKFKTIIDMKIERYALIELNKMKAKHSKSGYLKSSSFQQASYLVDSNFSKKEAQLLFKLRSKSIDAKLNFQKEENAQFQENLCRTCHLFPESQGHLLQCPEIVPKLKLLSLENCSVDENWMYSNINNQLKISKVYTQILEIRKTILENGESEVQSVTDWPVQAVEISSVCSNYDSCKL
jgi:hypothetical protein